MNDFISMLENGDWQTGSRGPRYLQLRRRIQLAIDEGVLKENEPLPSEREIAVITDLSRVTVRKAVAGLVEDRTVVQKRGSGSFVAPRVRKVEQRLSSLTSFSEDMARRGLAASSEWLQRGLFPASPEEIFALGLSSGERVARVERLRKADGIPMAIERASLSEKILPNPEKVSSSLYAVLRSTGMQPVRAIQRISARCLEAVDAEILKIPIGSAGLKIERVSYQTTGQVVEFTRSVYRGDAYDFVAELQISEE
ncbi:GntR family transcriptional regulator [Labrenzia sp. EL_208]|uniref:GntR family transcriptional regulator n=1 Tax=Roseibium album TaxID=311410 RepID=UPI000CF17E99|nr:GntR family transcriptional regulator [Roseibium album]MBG6147147.1 GntR family transcriptional regulator [Labrenzia sp. EL_142]MBG6159767.1 GntR family transcriptional regulator [Labrenzia sp. EL_162]MBG6165657.1 GntR family transcriptional regulator [Labrenzia sp. EL_195]MBG6176531.1 GntR family transcriptional regulator [Labrenzia sp. EL_132]MBG6198299.1 GntR family transcriptional regulator [Labrenzia sp. EL_159]MBG6201918.1 GntR family transcriptional regulator [Labrenzia sp. EL_13]M